MNDPEPIRWNYANLRPHTLRVGIVRQFRAVRSKNLANFFGVRVLKPVFCFTNSLSARKSWLKSARGFPVLDAHVAQRRMWL